MKLPGTMSPSVVFLLFLATPILTFLSGSNNAATATELDGENGRSNISVWNNKTVLFLTDGVDFTSGLCPDLGSSGQSDPSERLRSSMALIMEVVGAAFRNNKQKVDVITIESYPCGDSLEAVQKLLTVITTRHVTGVITALASPSTQAITQLTGDLRLPTVQMATGDQIVPSSTNDYHYILPHYSLMQMQIFLDTAKQFKWTSVSAMSTNQALTVTDHRVQLFQTLASEHQLCVTPAGISHSIPVFVFNSFTHNQSFNIPSSASPQVFFQSSLDGKAMAAENKSVDALELVLKNGIWDNVFKNLNLTCATNHSYGVEFTQKFVRLCDHVESMESYRKVDLVMKGGNLLTALAFLLHDGNPSSGFACNFTTDPHSVETCPLLGKELFKLDTTSKVVTSEMMDYTILYHQKGGIGSRELSVPVEGHTYPHLFNIDCGEFCHLCYTCFPYRKSFTNVMISRYLHPVKIVGSFSLHERNCKDLNIKGVTRALAFLTVIEAYNRISDASKPSSKIQGIVIDSCDSQLRVNSVIDDIEACRHSFPVMTRNDSGQWKGMNSVTLQPNLISAYLVEQSNYLPSQKVRETIIAVDEAGYSSESDVRLSFIKHLVKSLIYFKWTVVNVIVSQNEYFTTMSEFIKDLETSGTFCVVNVIQVEFTKGTGLDFLYSVSKALEQTSVFVMITSKEDTEMFLKELTSSGMVTLNQPLQFVFTPWNSKLVDLAAVAELTSVNIIVEPKIEDETLILKDFSSTKELMYRYPDISKVLKDNDKNLDEIISEEYSYLQVLQSSILALMKERAFHETTNSNKKLESTAMDIFVKYSNGGPRKFIGRMDKTLSMEADVQLEPHNQCQTWCPSCNACSGSRQIPGTYFFRPGDLIITGLFSLHDKGDKAFQCGRVQYSEDTDMSLASSFILAIDSLKMRYPNLLTNLSLGGLILDSCADPWVAAKTIADFESCNMKLVTDDEKEHYRLDPPQFLAPDPVQNLAYFIGNKTVESETMSSVFDDFGRKKFNFITPDMNNDQHLSAAVVKSIKTLGWNHAVILIEISERHERLAQKLMTVSNDFHLCIIHYGGLESGNEWKVGRAVKSFQKQPIIVVAQQAFVASMFKWLGQKAQDFFWFLPVAAENWYGSGVPIQSPVGAFYFRFPSSTIQMDTKQTENTSPWLKEFRKFRHSCDFSSAQDSCPDISNDLEPVSTSPYSSSVVRMVDAVAHKLNQVFVENCGNQSAVCRRLVPHVRSNSLGPWNVSFVYRGEMVHYDGDGNLYQTLSILMNQSHGLTRVGKYYLGDLNLDVVSINEAFFNKALAPINASNIVCETCQCRFDKTERYDKYPEELSDYNYHTSRGDFIDEIWTKVIVAISCFGAFSAFCLFSFVMYKVCRKAIGLRYVRLGQFLLISLIILYVSVIPFVLTPNEVICGLRYLFPAVSFALCFAGILVKLMSLQSYKIIGLGGELSWANQFITIFFIVGVQIAISTQRWHYNYPTSYSVSNHEHEFKYACHFDRLNFCLHHIYNLLLLIMCSFYAIVVRKEKKNQGEARLLLISCWLCVVLWLACPICLFVLDDFYTDKVITVAVLACTFVIHLIVFIPKLRMVARLKYSVSQRSNPQNQNGYSVDTDFLYERPFSLPGTLTSTFSTLNKTKYPKTISAVELDINY